MCVCLYVCRFVCVHVGEWSYMRVCKRRGVHIYMTVSESLRQVGSCSWQLHSYVSLIIKWVSTTIPSFITL